MLFTAPAFLFAFLPLVLAGSFVLGRFASRRAAVAWLAAASLVFYGWDRPQRLLPILLGSVAFNYAVAWLMARRPHRTWLVLGVAGNLGLLGWFKYAGFVAANLAAAGLPVPALRIALPIGISFFTFTQIAFLVDTHRGRARPGHPLDYTLFVTFFPHLVAGPILHHAAVMPQFARPGAFRAHLPSVALGLSWFAAGLFKKVMLADGVAGTADAAFAAASQAAPLAMADAWLGVLAYALQLYFDFSGYSDMAIGLALLVGITFPLNFFSPYQAPSLIEFWRRWHMTLSGFLRDYLYIPLGGSRCGTPRRLLNLVLTMLLGGLWHGAAWGFVVWGGLHGVGLAANHLWRAAAVRRGLRLPPLAGQAATLLLVVLAWVPFRADTLTTAVRLWHAMLLPGAGSPAASAAGWAPVTVLAAVALLAPNTAQLFGRAPGAARLAWRPTAAAAVALGAGLGLAVAGTIAQPSAFLYFRF